MPKRRTTLTPNPLACAPSTSFTPTPLAPTFGSDFHVVAVAPPGTDCVEVRSFGACTADLHALADWLKQHRVDTVAMEATGVYWIALYDLLEARGSRFSWWTPARSNGPRAALRATPRTPSGFAACTAWVLLKRPPSERPTRASACCAVTCANAPRLVTECGRTIQHMQKALEQINVKLTEAVSEITCKTGLSIFLAFLDGERDPTRLRAQLCDRRCQQDAEQIAPGSARDLGEGRSTSSRI